MDDEIECLDDIQGDEAELANRIAELIQLTSEFYDREMERYQA